MTRWREGDNPTDEYAWDPTPEPEPSEQSWDPTDRARYTDLDSPWRRAPVTDPDARWGQPYVLYTTPAEIAQRKENGCG